MTDRIRTNFNQGIISIRSEESVGKEGDNGVYRRHEQDADAVTKMM